MSEQTRPAGTMIDLTAADSDIAKVNGQFPRSIFVGTAGTVKIMDAAGNVSTWTAPAGCYITATVRQVKSTGTTASGFVALY